MKILGNIMAFLMVAGTVVSIIEQPLILLTLAIIFALAYKTYWSNGKKFLDFW